MSPYWKLDFFGLKNLGRDNNQVVPDIEQIQR
jgi:hypothetical protein